MKLTSLYLILVVLSLFLLSSCNIAQVPGVNMSSGASNVVSGFIERSKIDYSVDNRSKIDYSETDINESDVSLVLHYIEGDLIDLQPKAVDPDKDVVQYSFSEPFNEAGIWQTKDGDAGKYLVTITATDGDLTTKEYVLVVVDPRNKPPVIDCSDNIIVYETETVNLNCHIYDIEHDSFDVYYSGWMSSDTYTTNYDDAGEHSVLVTAVDSNNNTAKKIINVLVKNKNRLPVVEPISDIYATETYVIALNVSAYDPDGDDLTVSYSEPFDSNGVWTTKDGDSGVYSAYVKVSDGTDVVIKRFKIYIDDINTKPVIKPIPTIVVNEGDTVKIHVDAYDAENDPLTVTYSGWMSSDTYTTNYDDAGTHYVTVTVSDGQLEATQRVKIIVNNVNRPPVFVVPG